MLMTYWLFHLFFTVPQTLVLYGLLRPMLSAGDHFRFFLLSIVAVTYAFPWDSYVIHQKIWTYAPWAINVTIIKVPIEEIFFFVIQTVLTGYLYTAFTVPILPSLYILPSPCSFATRHPTTWSMIRWTPSFLFAGLGIYCWTICEPGTHSFYITCFGLWAMPVCTFLWSVTGDHILLRPKGSVIWPIIIPTIYLCYVDIVALRSGTWSISERTSLGIFIWTDLPIEEAVFFLITNFILVLAFAAIEKNQAINDTWPELLSDDLTIQQQNMKVFSCEHVMKLLKTVKLSFNLTQELIRLSPGLLDRPSQLSQALEILHTASKSFYSASLIFSNFRAGRSKFVILYAFCRETDDLIDNAVDVAAARQNVALCRDFLNLLWPEKLAEKDEKRLSENGSDRVNLKRKAQESRSTFESELSNFVNQRVPSHARPTFILFASLRSSLSRGPFDELVNGYAYDSLIHQKKSIETEEDLLQYSRWVAGSIGELCVELMWAIEGNSLPRNKDEILMAANDMGVALQLVNIARDVREDASNSRVYIPANWFGISECLTLEHLGFLRSGGKELNKFPYAIVADKLLKLAATYRTRSTSAINHLPHSFRPGVRAATELYLAIGSKLSNALDSKEWNGQRVYLSKIQKFFVVANEIWGFTGIKT